MKYTILLVLILTFSLNLQAFKTLKINTPDSSKYFILKYDKDFSPFHFKENVTNVALSKNELKLIDSLLKDAVSKHNKAMEESENKSAKIIFKLKKLSKYYKQLIAVINQKGEKFIFVNCLCSQGDIKQLKKELIIVEDGGNCYFNLKINLTQKISYDFYVNGVA